MQGLCLYILYNFFIPHFPGTTTSFSTSYKRLSLFHYALPWAIYMGRSERNASAHLSRTGGRISKWNMCPFVGCSWGLSFSCVHVGMRSTLRRIRFKVDESSTMLNRIKQRTVIEFLILQNETRTGIDRQ
jgi:hypothetical protein